MGMRKATILAKLEKALQQLEKNRLESAKKTLESITEKLDGDAKAPKRKPGKYALYVKAMFPKMQKQHPTLDAPGIMKKIAVEYRKGK